MLLRILDVIFGRGVARSFWSSEASLLCRPLLIVGSSGGLWLSRKTDGAQVAGWRERLNFLTCYLKKKLAMYHYLTCYSIYDFGLLIEKVLFSRIFTTLFRPNRYL